MAKRKRRREREPEPESRLPERWKLAEGWPFLSGAEIERRFEETIRARWGTPAGAGVPVDVFFHGREILIEVDLPGVERESVEVRLEEGEILVEAHRVPGPRGEDVRPARLERVRGRIRRRVPLPARVESGRLEFDLEGGVLRVRLRPGNDA